MPQVGSRKLDLDLDLVVDQDADPFDEDLFLDVLDRLVERRLKQRIHSTDTGTPAAAVDLDTGGKGRQA